MPEPPTLAFTLRALEIHLIFATLVALAAWAVTLPRRVSATTKYWIWVATSINFVLPIGVLIERFRPPDFPWVLPLEDFGNEIARKGTIGAALAAGWLLGLLWMLLRLWLRIRAGRIGAEVPSVPPVSGLPDGFLARGVPVRFEPSGGIPSVDGLLRPRIALPAGIHRVLTAPELDAILLHELTHARRRDNLIRLLHEIAVCVFWFHPLVWLTGSRLSLFRELSCDEAAIRGARGEDLLSALAKLANPAETLLLQAGASSFVMDRVALLVAPRRTSAMASAVQAVIFAAVLLAAILGSAFQSNLMHRAGMGQFCPRHAGK
jgi:hypothetical protein